MFPENVLKYKPWSYSMANTAITCPLAFNKRYVDHEPRAEPENRATSIGKVVHTLLEIVCKGAPVNLAFKRIFEVYDLTHDMAADIKTFRGAVNDFARGLISFDRQFGIAEKFIESEFAIDNTFQKSMWKHPNTVFRGKMDLVLVTKEKPPRAIMIDHKSGAVKKVDYHVDQLDCYNVLLDAAVPGLRAVRSGIHSVAASPDARGKRTVWLDEVPIDVVKSQGRDKLINFLTDAANAAETRSAHKGWMCAFCGYKPVCPEYT